MSNFQGIRAVVRLMATAVLSLLVAFGASAQTVRYIHTDGLGSPVLATDKDRNVLERSEYEPYGSLLNRPATDEPGYGGHVMDATTAMSYMQQRYYDPQLGLFLSTDPMVAYSNPVKFFNRYKYAANNPYTFKDPDGRAEYFNFPGNIVVVVQTYENRSQFTNEQIESEASKFNGPTSDGKRMMVKFIPGAGRDAAKIKTNNSLSDAPGSNNRSNTDHVNGREVNVAPDAVGKITVGHELGHVMGAGDQYQGGVDANGRPLTANVPGTSGAIMRDYGGGNATQKTRDEIMSNANKAGNRTFNCSSMEKSSCR